MCQYRTLLAQSSAVHISETFVRPKTFHTARNMTTLYEPENFRTSFLVENRHGGGTEEKMQCLGPGCCRATGDLIHSQIRALGCFAPCLPLLHRIYGVQACSSQFAEDLFGFGSFSIRCFGAEVANSRCFILCMS